MFRRIRPKLIAIGTTHVKSYTKLKREFRKAVFMLNNSSFVINVVLETCFYKKLGCL